MNKKEVEKRIKYIEDRLSKLGVYIEKYNSTKVGSEDNYSAFRTIERECEEIVESAVRINQEILSSKGILGETYRDSFEQLLKIKIKINKEDMTKLANTTGFRNRLAHDYIDLNEKITVKSAENILRLYPKYLLAILDYIED